MMKVAAACLLSLFLPGCSKAPEAPAARALTPVATVSSAGVAVSATTRDAASAISWIKPDGANIAPVFAQAKTSNKPVFLYWGAVWCPPCNQIKATVFTRQDFIERSQLFLPVYLDGDTPGAQKLAAHFNVRGYPTMILFRPDGTELTRLPGEVDAARYMEVLGLGLASVSSVKQSLSAALGGAGATMTPEAWRMLAFYAWDADDAQLVRENERAPTLERLARACPKAQRAVASRLLLLAIAATGQAKGTLSDVPAALKRVHEILADGSQARENFDLLVNYGADMLPVLSRAGSAERRALTPAMNAALEHLATDSTLSTSDRLSAVSAKVALVRLDFPRGARPRLDPVVLAQVRELVATADKAATSTYERQAVIPQAADLLAQAGLLDESDALIKAELPKAISPYYHMLVLAGNAQARGNKAAALDWTQKAWEKSVGPATRLQWGGVYVGRLLELTPQDAARIEKAASSVLAELEPVPETFYERNRRSLEKMGQRLLVWNGRGQQAAVMKKLSAQLDAVCAKLPTQDEARTACAGVFKARAAGTKA